jgi:hypothetical protein
MRRLMMVSLRWTAGCSAAHWPEAPSRAGCRQDRVASNSVTKAHTAASSRASRSGRRPSRMASITAGCTPALAASGACVSHSKSWAQLRDVTRMASSLSFGGTDDRKRRYSPVRCSGDRSSGLRSNGTNGPLTPPRGPFVSSSANLPLDVRHLFRGNGWKAFRHDGRVHRSRRERCREQDMEKHRTHLDTTSRVGANVTATTWPRPVAWNSSPGVRT